MAPGPGCRLPVESARRMKLLRRQPLLAIPLFFLLYGYGTIDVADFQRLSAAPLALNTDAGKQFLQFSPLPYFLGYPFTRAVGARPSFVIVMGAGLVLFVLSLRRLAAQRYGLHKNDAMLMLLATPLLIVMTQYIGKSDPYVVGFALLLPTLTNPLLQMLVAGLVVLSHFEMGLLILASAMVLGIVPWRAAIAGGVLGFALIYGYHHYLLPAVPQSRADIGMTLLREALDAFGRTPVLHLIFTFGPFWVCVFGAGAMGWRWLLMLAGTALVAAVTIDFTRVFIIVGLPLAIAVVDRIVARLTAAAGEPAPAWLGAVPLLVLVQAHLIGLYVYDSRMVELARRLLD
jgi:hypothetical protein